MCTYGSNYTSHAREFALLPDEEVITLEALRHEHSAASRVVIFIVTLERSLRSIKHRIKCVMSCCDDRPFFRLMLKHPRARDYYYSSIWYRAYNEFCARETFAVSIFSNSPHEQIKNLSLNKTTLKIRIDKYMRLKWSMLIYITRLKKIK